MRALRPFLVAAVSAASLPAAFGQTPFTEEASTRGVTHVTPVVPGLAGLGYGISFTDLDNDGDPDLLALGASGRGFALYENDGTGHFSDHTLTCGIPKLEQASGVVAFDYDGDRDLDLLITQVDRPQLLMRAVGPFQFQNVTDAAQLTLTGPCTGPSVGDYDGDGWLDLFVPEYGPQDHLYRNLGNGTFQDVATAQGITKTWRGFQGVFFDMDRDRDLDLFISNDKKEADETEIRNQLYENVGGNFVDVSAASGVDVNIYSMGVACGDFDRNGYPDLYSTNIGIEPNSMVLGQGNGVFTIAEALTGTESFRTGWGAIFFDYDHDAHLDLYVCNAETHGLSSDNRLYTHGGTWPCSDVAPTLQVDQSLDSFGAAVADIDNDGDLDLAVQNAGGPMSLYVNPQSGSNHWVKFRLWDDAPNHYAVGATVDVLAGGVSQTRQVVCGGNSYKSQNDMTVHFGLGSADTLARVIVRFPSGAKRILRHVVADRTYDVFAPAPTDPLDKPRR